MNQVRMKDLALVAFAGGLLAFELVSIGEALPGMRQALADRGLSGKANVASAGAAAAPVSAFKTAGSAVSQAVVGVVTGHAHMIAAATAPGSSKRCLVLTRAGTGRRMDERLRVVTLKGDGSCAVRAMVSSRERVREVEKAVDLALKQATL